MNSMLSTTTARPCLLYGSEKGFETLAEIGFQAVDYSATCDRYQPFKGLYAAPADEFEAFFKRESDLIQRTGLRVRQTHAPFPTYPDPRAGVDQAEEFRFMIDAIKKSIRATQILNGEYVVIHCAMVKGWQTDDNPDYTREVNYKVFSELLPYARECGVRIALENMPCAGIPTAYPEQLIDYIDMMGDSEFFTACLDTGHANITRAAAGEASSAEAFVRALGSRLKVLHIHDNNGGRDEHTCPFLGNVNWGAFMQALCDIGYSGTFSLEADSFSRRYPDEFYVQSETHMYNISKYLCEAYGL